MGQVIMPGLSLKFPSFSRQITRVVRYDGCVPSHPVPTTTPLNYYTRTSSRTTQTAFCVPNPIGQAGLEILPQEGITSWLFFPLDIGIV